jgi:hypothetical protein
VTCYAFQERLEPVCPSYAHDRSYTDCIWGCALWDHWERRRAGDRGVCGDCGGLLVWGRWDEQEDPPGWGWLHEIETPQCPAWQRNDHVRLGDWDQELAAADTADRELLPYPGGLAGRVAFMQEQLRRHREGLEPLPEEGVLWTTRR